MIFCVKSWENLPWKSYRFVHLALRRSHFTLWNPKVIFNSIIHTYLWLFMLSQKKKNCNPLAHPPENVTTLTCELQNFFIRLKVCCVLSNVGGSEESQLCVVVSGSGKNRLWSVATVMSGKQSQQVFRVTIFCFSTCFQSFSMLISRIVHHAVLKFSPCRSKLLPQASTCLYQIHVLLL